ncbi:2TM domain-containing protein [Salinimicrobium soli]|uniref:2TM domain-containing protein n=1 Tax=Salinimicrobium soli TaxID=1254399 RepID=UPI003AAEF3FA
MRPEETIQYEAAKRRVKKIRGFYIHLTVYIIINIFLFIVGTWDEGIIAGMQDLSNYATAFFWGIGLLAHGAGVFAPDFFFGKKWEEKKIRELMEKEKRQHWE